VGRLRRRNVVARHVPSAGDHHGGEAFQGHLTDRDLFAGLIMAAFAATDRERFMAQPTMAASCAVDAADHLIAALKIPVGGKPSNAMRGRRQDDIDDRNA
jgi:hypothetical protein